MLGIDSESFIKEELCAVHGEGYMEGRKIERGWLDVSEERLA